MNPKYPNSLVYYRRKHKYTQQDIVGKLRNVTINRLSNWEQGKTMPDTDNWFILSILYNTPPEKLYPVLYQRIKQEMRKNKTLLNQ